MTLPASGVISLNDVNVELNRSGTTTVSLNDSDVRTLFGKSSGQISLDDGHGKSNRVSVYYNISSNTADLSVDVSSLSGYLAGHTDLYVTVGFGVYVYSTSTSNAALSFTNAASGDILHLTNQGFIMGKGGDGGYGAAGQDGGAGL